MGSTSACWDPPLHVSDVLMTVPPTVQLQTSFRRDQCIKTEAVFPCTNHLNATIILGIGDVNMTHHFVMVSFRTERTCEAVSLFFGSNTNNV